MLGAYKPLSKNDLNVPNPAASVLVACSEEPPIYILLYEITALNNHHNIYEISCALYCKLKLSQWAVLVPLHVRLRLIPKSVASCLRFRQTQNLRYSFFLQSFSYTSSTPSIFIELISLLQAM